MDEDEKYPWRPARFKWNPTAGTYTLTAKAIDIYGAAGELKALRVVVK